jgi:hypothetical protein
MIFTYTNSVFTYVSSFFLFFSGTAPLLLLVIAGGKGPSLGAAFLSHLVESRRAAHARGVALVCVGIIIPEISSYTPSKRFSRQMAEESGGLSDGAVLSMRGSFGPTQLSQCHRYRCFLSLPSHALLQTRCLPMEAAVGGTRVIPTLCALFPWPFNQTHT